MARALRALDLRYRSVVVCRYLLEMSEEQTAAALDIPAGTVKSRLHRAGQLLRVELAHLRGDGADTERGTASDSGTTVDPGGDGDEERGR